MRKINLSLIMLAFISCSTDNSESEKVKTINKKSARNEIRYPNNFNNEFDVAGQLHNELSESYVVSGKIPTSVAATLNDIETIAFQNELFTRLSQGYLRPLANRLEDILERPAINMSSIISDSPISSRAKASLTMFINHIMDMEAANSDYESLYHYVVAYEEGITNDSNYSNRDREIILITSSITRHASYFAKAQKKKPRDKDWDLVIANIITATEGANHSITTAATMAATAGILSNP